MISAVSAIAIGNSLFFGSYLLSVKKNSRSNLFLALLLFALALRIGKSVIAVAFPEASNIFPAMGLVGMSAIGPLLFLYIRFESGKEQDMRDLIHFVPALFLILTMPFVGEYTLYSFYQFIAAQMLVYIAISLVHTVRKKVETGLLANRRWLINLIIGIALIWLAFFIQLTLDSFLSYFVATTTAAVVLYVLAFWAIKRQKVLFGKRRKNVSIAVSQIAESIRILFEEEHVYRQFDLTLNTIAERLGVRPYLVSQTINENFQKSLPELINEYRVADMKHQLCDPDKKDISIEAMAYDSGFATPSAFYASFKKFTGMTPGQFRKERYQ